MFSFSLGKTEGEKIQVDCWGAISAARRLLPRRLRPPLPPVRFKTEVNGRGAEHSLSRNFANAEMRGANPSGSKPTPTGCLSSAPHRRPQPACFCRTAHGRALAFTVSPPPRLPCRQGLQPRRDCSETNPRESCASTPPPALWQTPRFPVRTFPSPVQRAKRRQRCSARDNTPLKVPP